MHRINITDSAQWFDADKATSYDGYAPEVHGKFVDVNTGDEWTTHTLYHTKMDQWVLVVDSAWAKSRTAEILEPSAAYAWLARNRHHDAIPPEVDDANSLDSTGSTPRRTVRIPDDLWDRAQSTGNASGLINHLLTDYFGLR